MNAGRTTFSQIMDHVPLHDFRKCVRRYGGHHRIRRFSCWDQFLSMAFAQLTYRESLRDIETCLRPMQPRLYHMGFRGQMAKSTLADANETRDWRIYADFAQILIQRARNLYAQDSFGISLEQTVYAFDSTTIDLCLSLFPWAHFRKHKAAVKLHTLIDLRGNIPCFVHVTDGKVHDVNALDHLILEAGAFYIMDRGYIDFARLYVLTQSMAFFVTRAKRNMKFSRVSFQSVDKTTGICSDQSIRLQGFYASQNYPGTLRRIHYVDHETKKRLVFLTNNFSLPALTIAHLYKARWQVELFFKWIKQNLRIKSFYGTSENAVKTQIWIAITVYVLVAILKKERNISRSLNEILQVFSITIFERNDINQSLSEMICENKITENGKQLLLITS
jgi:transposase